MFTVLCDHFTNLTLLFHHSFLCLVDEAVQIAHDALFSNHGQSCCAGSRTFVQADVYDAFVKKATNLAKERIVGDPFQKGVQQGPQVI